MKKKKEQPPPKKVNFSEKEADDVLRRAVKNAELLEEIRRMKK